MIANTVTLPYFHFILGSYVVDLLRFIEIFQVPPEKLYLDDTIVSGFIEDIPPQQLRVTDIYDVARSLNVSRRKNSVWTTLVLGR